MVTLLPLAGVIPVTVIVAAAAAAVVAICSVNQSFVATLGLNTIIIALVQVPPVFVKTGLAAHVPLNLVQKVFIETLAVAVELPTLFHDCPPVVLLVHVTAPLCWVYTTTKSPSSIEAGGVNVMVVVAFTAEAPSTGTANEPKNVAINNILRIR